jgi:hypothetical protein
MPFESAAFAAGPYDVSYIGVDLGLMVGEQQAPATEMMAHGQLITNTHAFARTVLGVIGQGGEAFANMILMEWDPDVMATIWGATSGSVGTTSTDWFDYADELIFTYYGGTLAATTGPLSRTCHKAVLQEDFVVREMFGPQLREVPLRFRLFPESIANYKFWTDT